MAKFWQKFDFWMRVKATLATFGAGGEITLLVNQAAPIWHVITVVSTVGSIFITNFIKDENHNGIIDSAEHKRRKDAGTQV